MMEARLAQMESDKKGHGLHQRLFLTLESFKRTKVAGTYRRVTNHNL
jgi:hypothetical protein